MPGINVYELIILIVLALVILGPERLPQYANTLGQWVRKARGMAEDAKVRFKEETGTDFDAVDWQKYDPRQYDPRRIIREALAEDYETVRSTAKEVESTMDPRALFGSGSARSATSRSRASGAKGGALAAGMAGSAASGQSSPAAAADSRPEDRDPLEDAPAPFDVDAT
ncbi:hypothetical protein [Nesterenkonia flava]|uniref:Sec-independent protein translocase protein TatB n=1 Tax=Nesterenkonia flava TaxID=469799 RepID=A0ABU1FUJ3_9MICC|nr:hypothetical protein [Nesterenkonia flava]MDR5711858.1 hypothetical protein [Nesterenkonia flava]